MEGEERRGKGCVGRDGVSARREREREVGLLLIWQVRNLCACIRSSR